MTDQESKLTRRLRYGADLQQADVERLEKISTSALFFEAHTDLVRQLDPPRHVHVLVEGVACRYKVLPNGRRSIVAFILPGDFCDLHMTILRHFDYSICTLADSRIARLNGGEVDMMLATFPAINRACWWSTLVDEAVLREWLVTVGRRTSEEALAHLFCELYTRLNAVGLTQDHVFRLPFTQTTLADVLGISTVHVSRVLTSLRSSGLVELQDRLIKLPDFPALCDLAMFDATYLHLGRRNGSR